MSAFSPSCSASSAVGISGRSITPLSIPPFTVASSRLTAFVNMSAQLTLVLTYRGSTIPALTQSLVLKYALACLPWATPPLHTPYLPPYGDGGAHRRLANRSSTLCLNLGTSQTKIHSSFHIDASDIMYPGLGSYPIMVVDRVQRSSNSIAVSQFPVKTVWNNPKILQIPVWKLPELSRSSANTENLTVISMKMISHVFRSAVIFNQ